RQGACRQRGQGGGDVVVVVPRHGDHRVQPVQGRGELGLVVGDQGAQLFGHGGGARQQVDDGLAAGDEGLQQRVGVQDEGVQLSGALGEDAADVGGGRQQGAQGLVAAVDRA